MQGEPLLREIAESPEAEWKREAVRLYTRYAVEIVEAFGICPWAERARLEGNVTLHVDLRSDPTPETLAADLVVFGSHTQADIALYLLPTVAMDYAAFLRLFGAARAVYEASFPAGRAPFVMAAFHPEGPLRAEHAESLVSYLRRTPDPTLQLLRSTTLARLRQGRGAGTQYVDVSKLSAGAVMPPPVVPLSEQVAQRNFARYGTPAWKGLEAAMQSILRDREATYARLRRGFCPRELEHRELEHRLDPRDERTR